ncbi:general secretion pathway protein GspN, partial [Xanthomonas oryzae pv. oryzae]
MRLDMIGLRTWLLATVVGWAMLVCALAVAGLGKRVEL